MVEKFSKEGATVVFCGRSSLNGNEIEKVTHQTKFIKCDVRNLNEINEFFLNAKKFLGGLDAAVNNAGVSGDIAPFHLTEFSKLQEILEVNFYSKN